LEARLRQGEKMQAIGLLAGGVAHNFNNLLTVVLGCLEMARSVKEDSSRVSALLARAIDAARKGADLARHLLTFARLQPLNSKFIEPTGLLKEVHRLLQDSLPSNIRLCLQIAPRLGTVQIDPVEFELALLNVAMNARDAMPNGGKLEIHALSQNIQDPRLGLYGRYLVVAVADDGEGIAPGILPKVFEPFFTTKEIGKGTGLGLSQAYGFARQSHGAVDIDSTPGQGTRVQFFLPLAGQGARPPG
jgi:signal transduction histidine kinase